MGVPGPGRPLLAGLASLFRIGVSGALIGTALCGCWGSDEAKLPRKLIGLPDLGPVISPDQSTVTPLDGGLDMPIPTCEVEATCSSHDECGPTEICYVRRGLADYCRPTCQPDPNKGADCSGRTKLLVNQLDNKQTATCAEDKGCPNNYEHGIRCQAGTICYNLLSRVCLFPGLEDLGDACIITWDGGEAGEQMCKYPYTCFTTSKNLYDGICRQGCDSWPGGPGLYPCPPGMECLNLAYFYGIDWAFCCPPGSGCRY